MFNARLPLGVFRGERQQDRDDTDLPDPCTLARHIRISEVVACLRKSREECREEVAEERDENHFARKPERDRHRADGEDSRIDVCPSPATLAHEGGGDDER